jgi:hypothetical protein
MTNASNMKWEEMCGFVVMGVLKFSKLKIAILPKSGKPYPEVIVGCQNPMINSTQDGAE